MLHACMQHSIPPRKENMQGSGGGGQGHSQLVGLRAASVTEGDLTVIQLGGRAGREII